MCRYITEGWMSSNNNLINNPNIHKRSLKTTHLNSISNNMISESRSKGKILVLGGNGYLGSNVVKRALLNDYSVTSISRRGMRDDSESKKIKEYQTFDDRLGDARNRTLIESVLEEGGYIAVIHCIGILFDSKSGPLRSLNRFASVSFFIILIFDDSLFYFFTGQRFTLQGSGS